MNRHANIGHARFTYRLEHWGHGGHDPPRMEKCANPHGGELLELVTGDYAIGFRGATLAHTRDGLLVICGSVLGRIRTRGTSAPVRPSRRCADPFAPSERAIVVIGTLRKLTGKGGELRQIQYDTEKLGDGPSTYVHEFSRPFPTLATTRPDRRPVICGGRYRFTLRGIVG